MGSSIAHTVWQNTFTWVYTSSSLASLFIGLIYATRNVHFCSRTLWVGRRLFLKISSHFMQSSLQFNRHFCKLRKSRVTRSAASVAADMEADPVRMALAKELSPPMMWLVAAARNSWKSTAFLIRLSRCLGDVSTTAIKHAWTKLLRAGFMPSFWLFCKSEQDSQT